MSGMDSGRYCMSRNFHVLRSTLVFGCILTSACDRGVERVSGLNFQPKLGYVWNESTTWPLDTKWKPGLTRPDVVNIVSSQIEGNWQPLAGYAWVDSVAPGSEPDIAQRSNGTTNVVWVPGISNPDHPHVLSDQREGYWRAAKGYRLASGGTLDAVWTPRLRDPDRAHYMSAVTEGSWELEPGYTEVAGLFGSTFAQWQSGVVHPLDSCLISSTTPDNWVAKSGYHIEPIVDQRYKVVQDETSINWSRIFQMGLAAAVANSFGTDTAEDSPATKAWFRPAARALRDKSVETAVDELLKPSYSGSCAGHEVDMSAISAMN